MNYNVAISQLLVYISNCLLTSFTVCFSCPQVTQKVFQWVSLDLIIIEN